eukprot:gene6176-7154_t
MTILASISKMSSPSQSFSKSSFSGNSGMSQSQSAKDFVFMQETDAGYVRIKLPSDTTEKSFKIMTDTPSKTLVYHTYRIVNSKIDLMMHEPLLNALRVHHNRNDRPMGQIQDPSVRAIIDDVFPPVAEPTLSFVAGYEHDAPQVRMEHYSTVRQLSLNESEHLCLILEPIIGVPLMPCVSESSLPSVVYSGLVPRALQAPFFVGGSLDDAGAKGARSRFLQTTYADAARGWMRILSMQPDSPSEPFVHESIRPPARLSPRHLASKIRVIGQSIGARRDARGAAFEISELLEITHEGMMHVDIAPGHNFATGSSVSTITKDPQHGYLRSSVLLESRSPSTNPIEPPPPTFHVAVEEREAQKSGFHRDLFTSVRVTGRMAEDSTCTLLVLEHFDQGVFVDKYEVDEIDLNVHLYQLIDLEKPSYTSTQNYVSASVPLVLDTQLNITMPIHLRYQNPGYTTSRATTISAPNFFIRCVSDDPEAISVWHRASLSEHIQPIVVEVPVGQLTDQTNVSLVTLLVTIAGSLFVVTAILTRPSQSELRPKNQ